MTSYFSLIQIQYIESLVSKSCLKVIEFIGKHTIDRGRKWAKTRYTDLYSTYGMVNTTTRTALQKLLSLNIIIKNPQNRAKGRNGRTPNKYKLNLEWEWENQQPRKELA